MDLNILLFIQNNLRNGFLDIFFSYITTLGNTGIFWIILGSMLLCFKKYRKLGFLILIGLLITAFIGEIGLKNIICRPRPFITNDVDLIIPSPSGYSFPSGHTSSSFCSAIIIYAHNKKWGIVAVILAILIAISRIYLFVHYPTDIIAGAILGASVGFVIQKSFFKEK